jgi:hypothetical protein
MNSNYTKGCHPSMPEKRNKKRKRKKGVELLSV